MRCGSLWTVNTRKRFIVPRAGIKLRAWHKDGGPIIWNQGLCLHAKRSIYQFLWQARLDSALKNFDRQNAGTIVSSVRSVKNRRRRTPPRSDQGYRIKRKAFARLRSRMLYQEQKSNQKIYYARYNLLWLRKNYVRVDAVR